MMSDVAESRAERRRQAEAWLAIGGAVAVASSTDDDVASTIRLQETFLRPHGGPSSLCGVGDTLVIAKERYQRMRCED